jgi:NADH:ubiquinone oxidoreductase subunit E
LENRGGQLIHVHNELLHEKFVELDAFIDGLEEKEGSLITVLHKTQEIFGYLPKEIQLHVRAKSTSQLPRSTALSHSIPISRKRHVVSTYQRLHGHSLFRRGAEEILKDLQDKLKSSPRNDPDGSSLSYALRCVGACGLAPVVMVMARSMAVSSSNKSTTSSTNTRRGSLTLTQRRKFDTMAKMKSWEELKAIRNSSRPT